MKLVAAQGMCMCIGKFGAREAGREKSLSRGKILRKFVVLGSERRSFVAGML